MTDQDSLPLDTSQPGLLDKAELHGQAGLASYVVAQIFGSPSLPRETPDWMKVAVESQANFAQRLPHTAELTLGAAGGGPLDLKTKQERAEEANAEAVESLRSVAGRMDREREAERQHETQWLSDSHSYAGQTLTGREWRDMMAWFGDAENVAGWEDAVMAETGQSREEVRRTGGKMKRFYDLMDKDAKGTLSGEEKNEFTTLQQDDAVQRGVDAQRRLQSLHAGRGFDQTARSDAAFDGGRNNRLDARAKLDEDVAGPAGKLATVEPLSPAYRGAAHGSGAAVPLPPAAPVASNTVQVSLDHTFG